MIFIISEQDHHCSCEKSKLAQTYNLDLAKNVQMLSHWCLGSDHRVIRPPWLFAESPAHLIFQERRSQRYRHRQ